MRWFLLLILLIPVKAYSAPCIKGVVTFVSRPEYGREYGPCSFNTTTGEQSCQGGHDGTSYYDAYVRVWHWNGTQWGMGITTGFPSNPGIGWGQYEVRMGSYSSVDNPPTSQGCELCPNEKAQAQQECDPGGYQIDLTTCEYTCDCTVEHAAKVQECGGITHIKSYDYSTCTGECDCSALKFAKEAECGGAEYLENWNEETCTGNCYCENDDGTPKGPLSVSYSQLSGFCGGVSKVESWNKLTCSGECGDCSDEYAELETQCGVAGVDRDTWVESTCSGECKLDCSVELAAKETECGIEGVDMSTWSDQTCTGECRKSCTEEMNSLEDKCGIAGVDNESFDFQECTGKCNDCETKTKSCSKECGGFVASYNCRENADGNGNITGIVDDQCECGKPELLVGGGDDAIPQPGDAGGNVTPNPDGSHDETLPDGTVIHYSKNGLSVTIERPDGSTYNRTWSQNSEGQWVHSDISTDAEGNWRKTEETALTDGQGTVETVTNGHNDIPGTNHEVVDNTTTNTHTDPPDTQPEDNEPETSEEAEGKQDADVSITSVGHITKPSSVQKNYVQAHQIDTSVFSQSVQAFSDTGPAQLAGGMVDLLQELVADPVAPRFEIPIAEWEMVIDLSVMDPVAAIARVLEMIILIMGTMFLLLRQWRAN
jgi:hypothetical protein